MLRQSDVDLAKYLGLNPEQVVIENHSEAMSRKEWQCPQCELGYQGYNRTMDGYGCPVCGYSGGRVQHA